jgi:hypothetical protein
MVAGPQLDRALKLDERLIVVVRGERTVAEVARGR